MSARGDERRRELERMAAQGDVEAQSAADAAALRAGAPPTHRQARDMASELRAEISRSIPRGSGPYGSRTAAESQAHADPLRRVAGLDQACAWLERAVTEVERGYGDGTHQRAIGDAWVAWATAKRLAARQPKRYPQIKWDAPS